MREPNSATRDCNVSAFVYAKRIGRCEQPECVRHLDASRTSREPWQSDAAVAAVRCAGAVGFSDVLPFFALAGPTR